MDGTQGVENSGTADPIVDTGGEGQVSDSFDVGSAVDSIGSDLGFKVETSEAKPTVAAAPAPATAVTDPATKDPAAATDPAATTPAVDAAPKTWKPEEAAAWAGIPEAAKAAILRREEDMFRGIEQYRGAASFGTTMQAVLQPFDHVIRAQNVNPVELVGNLLNAQYQLAMGAPERKVEMIRSLMQEYNIDPAALGFAASDDASAYADPQVQALQRELQEVRSGQAALQQERQRETFAKAQSEVEAFATDPANVHFDTVADDVSRMLTADRSLTLAKAYEQAVWSNPVTRAKEIARQDAEKHTKAAEEARQKAASAKAATAVNVHAEPKAGAATLPVGTMDDTMADTLRAIKNRSN